MAYVHWLATVGLLVTGACTALGPMPASTGLSAVPQGRPQVEATAGMAPGFLLSDSASAPTDVHGSGIADLAIMVEPDRLIDVPGLVVGARAIGGAADSVLEPILGYRVRPGGVTGDFSVAGFAYGTTASAQAGDGIASYSATRFGGELAADARVLQMFSWASLHAQAAVSATSISASGTYCVDSGGTGIDCDTSGGPNTIVHAHLAGVYPNATGTLALDLGEQHRALHVWRIALFGAVGEMPTLNNGVQRANRTYAQAGVSMSIGLGAPD